MTSTLGPMIACNLLAIGIGLLAILCNVIGMSLRINPDGPLGWLSVGLICVAGGVFVFGLTTPFWMTR